MSNGNNNNLQDYSGNPSPLSNESQVAGGGVQEQVVQKEPVSQPSNPITSDLNSGNEPNQPVQNTIPQSPEPPSASPMTSVDPSAGMQSPQVPYKKPFNFMKLIFFFFLVLVLGAGGYFGYNYFNSKKQGEASKKESVSEVTVTVSPSPTMGPDDQNQEVATGSSPVQNNPNEETIDFSKCNPGDGYSRSVEFGSTYLSVIDVDTANNLCQVEILNEVEGGYNKYSCKIPKSVGKINFVIGTTGSDFSKILSYCGESKSGNSLLQ